MHLSYTMNSEYLVYDSKINLKIGSMTKTNNGIIVKSAYDSEIKEYYSKWENVSFVDDENNLSNPTSVFFCVSSFSSEEKRNIKKLQKKHAGCVIYWPNENIIVCDPENIENCLQVCLFHGVTDIIFPTQIKMSDLTEPQKKLFSKIYIINSG